MKPERLEVRSLAHPYGRRPPWPPCCKLFALPVKGTSSGKPWRRWGVAGGGDGVADVAGTGATVGAHAPKNNTAIATIATQIAQTKPCFTMQDVLCLSNFLFSTTCVGQVCFSGRKTAIIYTPPYVRLYVCMVYWDLAPLDIAETVLFNPCSR